MLVKFDSKVGNLIMFGDVAVALLKLMGMSGDLPGALLASDIPAALENLRRGVAAAPDSRPGEKGDEKDRDSEPRVSLHQRAFPLIELLAACAKEDCDIVWQEYRPKLGGLL
ncbi:MAG: DUF1840 domain-containing protein [Betaproteobacteria bacterium]|nr:DUF1840 domain-containing protein [Betaproteobacteria bacterium]